jgi:hypothetical protein
MMYYEREMVQTVFYCTRLTGVYDCRYFVVFFLRSLMQALHS